MFALPSSVNVCWWGQVALVQSHKHKFPHTKSFLHSDYSASWAYLARPRLHVSFRLRQIFQALALAHYLTTLYRASQSP